MAVVRDSISQTSAERGCSAGGRRRPGVSGVSPRGEEGGRQ